MKTAVDVSRGTLVSNPIREYLQILDELLEYIREVNVSNPIREYLQILAK